MNNNERLALNTEELSECIRIAKNLPDAKSEYVKGYDIDTMQKFIDMRPADVKLSFIFKMSQAQSSKVVTNDDLEWITKIDMTGARYCYDMFYGCVSQYLTKIPLFDTSNIVSMNGMFHGGVVSVQPYLELPDFNTSNVTDMSNMCNSRYLKQFPNFDFSKVTNLNAAFNCATFENKDLGYLDFPSATNVSNLFASTNIVSIEKVKAPKITSTSNMFYYAQSLVSIGEFDMRNITSSSSMLYMCKLLTSVILKNIKCAVQVGSGTSYGHLLTIGSLIGLCYECRDTGSSKTLTVGSANLTKLANVYVKTIDITDEMVAVDDLVSEKLPFEAYVVDPDNTADITSHITTTRVSSVDELPEGAVLMSDYVVLKNWKLA